MPASDGDAHRTPGAAREPSASTGARRTLLISEWFLPVVGGSVNLFVNAYSRYPAGSVHVLTDLEPKGAQGPPSPFPTTRVSLRRYPMLRPESLAMYVRLLTAGFRLVRRLDIGEVHCGHVFPEALVAFLLKRLLGTPYVVYCHGEELAIQRRFAAKRRIIPRLYNEAIAVIANSENSARLLREVDVEPAKIHVIHPGVDHARFRPAPREASAEIRLLSVGRIQRRKGHAQVIRAVAALRESVPNLRYDIAGTGEELPRLEELVEELRLRQNVRFLGYVPDEELPRLYRECDVFVLANRHLDDDDLEGFGMVFLEAAASGRPVVGGNSGGVPDAVQDGINGILVDTDDVRALSEALERLATNAELRERMGAAGVEWARSRFDWSDVSRRIRELGDVQN